MNKSKGPKNKTSRPGSSVRSQAKSSPKPLPKSSAQSAKSKPANPFGEKKRPAAGKYSAKGARGPKRRRPDEDLEIILTDKELGEVTTIKRKLAEIREYKKILAEDGLKPDAEDKARESELIVRLLRIEKNAKMAARQRAKAAKTEAFREAQEKAEFAKAKKKSRDERFSDDDYDDE
jgi:hypothetical protein